MAYPVCITVPENAAPPTDCEADYIKHVDFGENDSNFRFEYRKMERTLLFEYLRRTDTNGSFPNEYLRRTDTNGSFPNNLMSVSFSTAPIVQDRSNNCCVDILKRNIFCEGRHYRYLGHSGSQFWEKKCYLMDASEDEIHDLLARFDNFVKITDVRKRAKRIGLLFVGFEDVLDLAEEDYKVEPDVKSGFFGTKPRAFTNSCGFMSPGFTVVVRRQLGLSHPDPSAIQVNYQGFQGTLVLKDVLTNAPQVQLRKSMQKFHIPNNEVHQHIPFIGILDYSKPHINGYLDTRLIILLQSRGMSINYLQTLHKGYIDLLKKILDDPASAQYFLRLKGRDAGDIRSEIDGPTREVLTTIKRNEIEEMIDRSYVLDAEDELPRRQVVRVRILVPKARVVFGVCDPHYKLEKGQCYFKPTLLDDEAGELSSEEQIVVARYPCYHPGDIQVLMLTHEKPGYENLKDCLVLPGKGHVFESCGGDLGGSKFFVSWDQQLVPKTAIQPCSYLPTKKENISEALASVGANAKWLFKRNRERRKRCRAELIEHFANFTDDLPQRIEKTYMKVAVTLGPYSKQCKQLSKMSYQAANQTVDRDVLSQKLAKFEKNESMSSAEASSSEGSPLLRTGEEEEEEEEEVPGNGNGDEGETSVGMTNLGGTGAVRFPFGSRRETSQMRHEVWKLEDQAKTFVEEALQEYPYV